MQIVILSGGSGSRLWPLSNDARSKQFLKILPMEGSTQYESMIQRVVRQICESGIKADITVATSLTQKDMVVSQLGDKVNVITEPSRRHTFPAICLACEYLLKVKKCNEDETVIVLPCDPFTGKDYYSTIEKIAETVAKKEFDLILMGIKPTYPSAKYGYILPSLPEGDQDLKVLQVAEFTEKPDVSTAEKLISEGALWNAGVFAFPLSFISKISDSYFKSDNFQDYVLNFDKYPAISFDHEVAEKNKLMGVVPFYGYWKDLGTWNTLTDELKSKEYGNVLSEEKGDNTHIINELNIPLLCLGTDNLIIAASPDGIIVADKSKSENVKNFANKLKIRPMIEERRWGSYKVIDYIEFPDGFHALTKQLTLKPGCSISYQSHFCRDEVWTFIDGEGEIVIDGVRKPVKRGDVINISRGQKHALKAKSPLTFIEVQHGSKLIEEDIERFPFDW